MSTSTSPLKTKNVRFCLRPTPEPKRSSSLPHIRVPPTSANHHQHKTTRICHDQSSVNITKIDDSTFEGQLKREFDDMLQRRKPSNFERQCDFIFYRRCKEPFIFTDRKRITFQPVPITKGTCSMVLTKEKKGLLNFDVDTKISKRNKLILKWNAFKWLIENRKDVMTLLWKNYLVFIHNLKRKGRALNKSEFVEILSSIGLERDKPLCEKIFWAFDFENQNAIDYKELLTCLEFFTESSFEEKLNLFFELCDRDNSGTLNQEEFYEILKTNYSSKEDKARLKKALLDLYNEVDTNRNGAITKTEFMRAALVNRELRKVLDESMRVIKKIDKYITSNFDEAFQSWLPGGFQITAKEGMHFPNTKQFVTMLKETEEVWQKAKSTRKLLKEEFVKVKTAQGIEVNAEIDEYGV